MTKAGRDLCNRPFDDVNHMNTMLANNWNERVTDEDAVLFLGDACMGNLEHSLGLIPRLNGTKIFIPGNHDRIHPYTSKPGSSKMIRWVGSYRDAGFHFRYDNIIGFPTLWGDTLVGPHRVRFCHFPLSQDLHHQERNETDKFAKWRPVDDGTWDFLVHGHVHDDWKVHEDGRQINIGCDVWDYAPVSDKQLLELMDELTPE